MTKKNFRKPKTTPIKKTGEKDITKNLVVQEINMISVDRSPKDIANWRDALINAENVFYPNRTRLYDLYKDVELDGHLSGIIQKRIDAVLNKNIWYQDASGKRVEEMDALIESTVFRNLVKLIMESILWGVSGVEFVPGKKVEFKPIERKHIRPDTQQILINQSDYEGIPYAGNPFIWVVGEPKDLGLYLKCSFYALIKKGGFSDWAQYVEIFGQPVRIIYYDAFDDKTRIQLKQVLDESGSSLALMIPNQAKFELMDGKTSNGDGQLQERLKNSCNDELSIIILGNVETTSSSHGGSNAKAQEQGKQQLEITKSDLAFVRNTLNCDKFIAILDSYGYKVAGGKFAVEEEFDYRELSQRVVIDTQVATQVPIADDYWYDTYGIPKPDNYDELKKKFDLQKAAATKAISAGQQEQEKVSKADEDPEAISLNPPLGGSGGGRSLSQWHKFRAALADFFDPALH
ncbi:phage portal protein family protein [Arachidicoccus soli]|uniref:DUF935 family protein n=1 Tax=Arachidicoccus soli TaxID=2341117 RepID=A0A386HS03_9BACT|nr:DUF935 family protein [Arachidicoccus soli]AYD48211.1 DUF935 family protein [Arachidicoccus soli]